MGQILNQVRVNYLALKVISNGVYPGEPRRMVNGTSSLVNGTSSLVNWLPSLVNGTRSLVQEFEYHDHREEVSRRATITLRRVLDFIAGKTLAELC